MEAVKISLLKYLSGAIRDSRTSTPKDYARWLLGKTPVVSVALGSIESGVAKLLVCEFFLRKTGAIETPQCETIQGASDSPVWWGMGSNEATISFLHNNAGAIGSRSESAAISFVKKSIELEIAAERQAGGSEVGPPIAVAKLDAIGLHLIEPGACRAEIKGKK